MAQPAPVLLKGLELLFAYMKRTGKNRRAVAIGCELDPGTITRICAGRCPDFMVARKFRDVLGIPFDAWHQPASKTFQRRYAAAA